MKRTKKTKPALWTQAFGVNGTNARGLLRDAYNRRVKEWLQQPENRICAACDWWRRNWTIASGNYSLKDFPPLAGVARTATQCHHKHGRGFRGGLLMVEELWIPVCAACHRWIHDNPDAARKLNLLAPVGQWNRRPN